MQGAHPGSALQRVHAIPRGVTAGAIHGVVDTLLPALAAGAAVPGPSVKFGLGGKAVGRRVQRLQHLKAYTRE